MIAHSDPNSAPELSGPKAYAYRMMTMTGPMVDYCMTRWSSTLFPEAMRRRQKPRLRGGDERDQLLWMLAAVCCTHRLDNGTIPVRFFADTAPGLQPEERATLRGWIGLQEGPFDVVQAAPPLVEVAPLGEAGPRLRVMTIVDPKLFEIIRPGCMVISNVVPVRDFYVTLGPIEFTPHDAREEILRYIQREMAHYEHRGQS